MKLSPTLLASSIAWLLLAIDNTVAVPVGFVDEGIADVPSPMDVFFLPPADPSLPSPLFVVDKDGGLFMMEDPDNNSELVLLGDISSTGRLCTNGSRGFMSAIPHPQFYENRWMYIFYVHTGPGGSCSLDPVTGPYSVVSRVLLKDDFTFDIEVEEKLLELSPMPRTVHVGGDMEFGFDGNLWITVGDGGVDAPTPQMPHYLLGSLLRITPEGGIPPDNPYQAPIYNNTGRCNLGGVIEDGMICEEIFALGIRSPYRFARDLEAIDEEGNPFDRFFIMDVGSNIFEEINEAGSHMPGVNYGYPVMEGPCYRALGKNNLDCSPEAGIGYQEPYHWYTRIEGEDVAAVGGAFVPTGVWPASYEDAFIFADYPRGETYHLSSGSGCRECEDPVPPTQNYTWNVAENANAMTFGPYGDTQALYYTQRAMRYRPTIRRIRYDDSANLSPICALQAEYHPDSLAATFNATGTYDPNGDALYFEWRFGAGDPPLSSPRGIQSYTYASHGKYSLSLKVTDGKGGSCIRLLEIQIGDPPTVSIVSPAEGVKFAVGDTFVLQAEGSDSTGAMLDDTSFTWEMRRHHNLHYHPWLAPTIGNNILTVPSPPPEDLGSVTTSYMEIIVTATDSSGLTSTISRKVDPKLVSIDLVAAPCEAGVSVQVAADLLLTLPANVILWENQEVLVDAFDVDGYIFATWSNGGAQTHSFTVPAGGESIPIYAAVYSQIPPLHTDVYSSLPMSSAGPSMATSDAPSGVPSAVESSLPSISVAPSWVDSVSPSDSPSTSMVPSSQPSMVQSHYPSRTPTEVPVPEYAVRITFGANSEDYIDSEGNTWVTDRGVVFNGKPRRISGDISGTDDVGIYQTYRLADKDADDNMFLRIPVDYAGYYRVRLFFMEPTLHLPGKRVFRVDLDQQESVFGIDVVETVGVRHTPMEYESEIFEDSGLVQISFQAEIEMPIISAIELVLIDNA